MTLLTHARDRREDIAYRASLDPNDDVLELKAKEAIFDPSVYQPLAIKDYHPAALYGWFGVCFCYIGLAFLWLSLLAFLACVAVAICFFSLALSYPCTERMRPLGEGCQRDGDT